MISKYGYIGILITIIFTIMYYMGPTLNFILRYVWQSSVWICTYIDYYYFYYHVMYWTFTHYCDEIGCYIWLWSVCVDTYIYGLLLYNILGLHSLLWWDRVWCMAIISMYGYLLLYRLLLFLLLCNIWDLHTLLSWDMYGYHQYGYIDV